MDTVNAITPLPLGGSRVDAVLVRDVKHFPVDGRTIVMNTGPAPALVAGAPSHYLPASSSTILLDGVVEHADSLVLLRTRDELRELTTQPGWSLFGDLLPGFPRETPLWRGPRHEIGTASLDSAGLLGEPPAPARPFRVWVNLWFAPAGTDCGIHNEHGFLEVHTQIHGIGRMQKFTRRDHGSLYEDVLIGPGTTHAPFCRSAPGGGFAYPWHQYHADTDCVWLAVEYHVMPA